MHPLAFLIPLAAASTVTLQAQAQQPAQAPVVSVTLGVELRDQAENLGLRELEDQAERLARVVERALIGQADFQGATVELVLVDIRPNRPTFAQVAASPGLDGMRSISTGGATIEGVVTLADGRRLPVRHYWYSSSLADVRGFGTWQDAYHAYDRFARRLASGRLFS